MAAALWLGACSQDDRLPTSPDTATELAVAGQPLSLKMIAAGSHHSCGLTTTNVAYCWGENTWGQLGDGSRTQRLKPVKVSGSLKFSDIRAGDTHTCGLTTDSLAYCWGYNLDGAVGTGPTPAPVVTPSLVSGGHRWRQVSAGSDYSCGITTGGVAYCWGDNSLSQLGLGPNSGVSLSAKPVKVAGSIKFRRLLTAFSHSCGATTDNHAYCWGDNELGQLGIGTSGKTTSLASPTKAVVGGLSWRQVLPGSGYLPRAGANEIEFGYSCGITTGSKLYCWGGTFVIGYDRKPVAVAPTRSFQYVNPASLHACALTLDGAAFCWGYNFDGELGNGGTTETATPTAVAGGHAFSGLSAGAALGQHTCGVTTDHRGFCWGLNTAGQLGDGTTTNRTTPVTVAAPG